MSRGGQSTLKNQLATTTANQQQAQGQANQLYGTVNAADKEIIANPISDAEKTARTEGTLQPLAESYDSAAQSATNMASRTKNDAGYQASLDKLAQSRASDTAKANQSLQADLGNTAFNRKMAATGQQQGMYGTATGAAVGYGGQATNTAGELANIQNRPGFWGTLGGAIAGGLGAGLGKRIGGGSNG